MLKILTKNWWVLTLKGVLIILFGLFSFFNPAVSAASLIIWFSLFIILDGILTLVTAIMNWSEREDKWHLVAEGGISLVLGLILLKSPGGTLLVVSFFIAFWFIFMGISRIAMAIQLRKEIEGEGWLIFGGAIAVIFGLIILARPIIGIGTLMYLVALTAVVMGIALVAISFKLRKGQHFLKSKIDSKLDH